ncbi:hypothetical protein [Marinagarivorans algicola]|uniref:hypothetical protein n=1 Tax=Marinagarivorans algicola TaxID=1513270 RepID=UPI0006B6633E|nr:hypothetical protein [Marinagarivorans algicola]
MKLSNLKYLRKLVPGTIFIFFGVPCYQYMAGDLLNIDESIGFVIKGYGVVLAIIIGSFLECVKIRKLINSKTHQKINNNIKSKLIENGLTELKTEAEIDAVKSSKQLMHIFYHLIDNDESLKEKSKLVRDNGLIWTSTIDIAIIGCFYSWLYFILIIFFGANGLLVSAGLMIGLIGLISGALLHPRAVSEHIALGDEQIDFIVTNHKNTLQNKITGLFN